MKEKAFPATVVAGAVRTNWDAVWPVTVIVPDVPVIPEMTVSVAVIDWEPAWTRVAENEPVPFVSVVLAGRVAPASVDVK